MWIRKVALRNSPVGCFNHRGFRRNGSESTTELAGTRVAVRLWDCTSQSRQARAQSEGKNRLFDSEINLYRLLNDILPFATLSRRGAQCAPGQRKIIRFVGEHSDSLRAACGGCSLDAHCGGCVRLYGLDCTDRIETVRRVVSQGTFSCGFAAIHLGAPCGKHESLS